MGEAGVAADPDQRFGRFVLPQRDALLRLATALTRQPADTEDLVQETLLRAYRAIDQFDGTTPGAWLFTIMRRANVDTFRRSRPVQVQDPHTMVETAGPGDRADDPGERAVATVFDDVVAAAFDTLPPRYRESVTLVDLGADGRRADPRPERSSESGHSRHWEAVAQSPRATASGWRKCPDFHDHGRVIPCRGTPRGPRPRPR